MMNLNALKIDPEFQGKIPPLNAEEEHILEQNMIQERRLLNPLIIWNGYILDGHSRYRILKHHPEIAFEVKEIQLPDRAEITALAQTPKEEIPAIIKELRKPKKDRKAMKPKSPEKSVVAADDAPDSNEVHTEDEIEPVSNSPPDFKRSIQGHKRCLTDEDRKRLRQSIDNRHHKTTVANGSIMMCEVQGAKEDFIRRWNLVFKDYPDVFEDTDCRRSILFLIDDTSAYLQTIKERVL